MLFFIFRFFQISLEKSDEKFEDSISLARRHMRFVDPYPRETEALGSKINLRLGNGNAGPGFIELAEPAAAAAKCRKRGVERARENVECRSE